MFFFWKFVKIIWFPEWCLGRAHGRRRRKQFGYSYSFAQDALCEEWFNNPAFLQILFSRIKYVMFSAPMVNMSKHALPQKMARLCPPPPSQKGPFAQPLCGSSHQQTKSRRFGSKGMTDKETLSTFVLQTPHKNGLTNDFRADFWGRGSDEALSVKKKGFSVKRGRDSLNWGFGEDFYRKGNSVKRSGPFSEPLDSENRKVAVQIHCPKNQLLWLGEAYLTFCKHPFSSANLDNLFPL